MIPIRGRFELSVVTVALALMLGVALTRMAVLSDDSRRQALISAGAHFIAGIEILQAESRIVSRRKLNAAGYPTGLSGDLRDDADCAFIWEEVMQPGGTPLLSRFVVDADGGGDRCEYLFVDDTATTPTGIVYWPLGSGASAIALGRRKLRVTPGIHVHVELGEVSL